MSELPKVLIIGDSISMQFHPFLERELAGRARLAHNEGNASDSGHLAENLEAYLAADADAKVIQFNCGLHDLRQERDGSPPRVSLQQYRQNLHRIAQRLKQTGKGILWASTTPVIDERHAAVKPFDRHERDVQAYNAVAAEVMAAEGIPVNDLHAVIVQAGPETSLGRDGVHMTEPGSRALAHAVAQAVGNLLA